MWNGAVRGGVWCESPHIYEVDGRYLLLTAEGGTEIHHAVVVAASDAITRPYVGDKANPVLTHRDLGRRADVVGVWLGLLATSNGRPTTSSAVLEWFDHRPAAL